MMEEERALEERTLIEAAIAFGKNYPDSRRNPIVAESRDWEQINPALMGLAITIERLGIGYGGVNALRVFAESVYCMGYERGKTERPMPEMIVKEA